MLGDKVWVETTNNETKPGEESWDMQFTGGIDENAPYRELSLSQADQLERPYSYFRI